MCLTHTWSQENRGTMVTFYVIQMKAEYLPMALLVLDIVSGGWGHAVLSMIGIFASHMYDFLTRIWPVLGGGTNYLTTPAFVHRLWGTTLVQRRNRRFGLDTGSSQSAAPSSAQTSARDDSSFGSAWSMRGAGRRLGGS